MTTFNKIDQLKSVALTLTGTELRDQKIEIINELRRNWRGNIPARNQIIKEIWRIGK